MAHREAESSRSPRGVHSHAAEGADAWTWKQEASNTAWDTWEDAEPGPPQYIDSHDLVLHPSTSSGHMFTVIGLHSCSGGPDDFVAFFHQLEVPFRSKIRFVAPCSPVRREEHHGWSGEMNSWFEYDTSRDGNAVKDFEQVLEQRRRLLALLDEERKLLPGGDARRLILWGLSQGAGLALDVALHAPFAVGGVLALRGMALEEMPKRQAEAPLVDLLAINGGRDRMCPPEESRKTYEALQTCGVRLTFEVEPTLGHAAARGRQQMNRLELARVNRWLLQRWEGLA